MHAVFKKLQLKEQNDLLIVAAPEEFEAAIESLGPDLRVSRDWRSPRRRGFVLVFVRSCAEIEALAPRAVQRLEADGLLWFAYPKKSSRRYSCDIGRDDSWGPLGELGFEGVRMIAVDEDWSALRLRETDRIKKFTRRASFAISPKGKRRGARG